MPGSTNLLGRLLNVCIVLGLARGLFTLSLLLLFLEHDSALLLHSSIKAGVWCRLSAILQRNLIYWDCRVDIQIVVFAAYNIPVPFILSIERRYIANVGFSASQAHTKLTFGIELERWCDQATLFRAETARDEPRH